MSDCQSLGSSQYPSGRFPKVSIGITTDKCSKTGSGLRKDAASLPAGGRTFSCQGAEETTRTGIVETSERNRSDDVENHKASAWFSTRFERSAHDEAQNAETVKFFINSASVLKSEIGVHRKFDTVAYGKTREKGRNVPRVEEVAFATVQETHVVDKGNIREEPEKTAEFNEKRLNSVTYGNRGERRVDVERTVDIAFSTKQLAGERNDKEPEEMAKCNNDVLKMKLWEILGTAPSENKHTMNSNDMEYKERINVNQNGENPKGNVAGTKLNSPDREQNKENLSINQSREYKKGKAARGKLNSRGVENKENLNIKQTREFHKRKAARVKQNSDTIETDSESPNEVMRRPVTRSLTHKKAPAKRVQKLQCSVSYEKKPLSSSSSDFKLKREKKNIFAFDEVEAKAGSLCGTSSGHSNRPKEKIANQNKAKIEPRRIHFPMSLEDKSLHNSDWEQSSLSPDKASPKNREKGNSSVPCQGKNQFMQTVDGTLNDSHHSNKAGQLNFDSPLWAYKRETRESTGSPLLKMKKHSWDHENSPPESKNTFLHDAAACRSMGRKTDESGDFHSPTFAEDMSPTPPCMPQNEVLTSPAAAGCSKSIQKNYNSKGLDNSTPGPCQADADSEASVSFM